MADTSPNRFFPPRYFPSGYFGSGGQDPGAMRASLSGGGAIDAWITYSLETDITHGGGGKPKRAYKKIVSAHQLIRKRIEQIRKITAADKARLVKAVETAGVDPAPIIEADASEIQAALSELDRDLANIRSRIVAIKEASTRKPPLAATERRVERSAVQAVDDAIRSEIALMDARRAKDELDRARLAAEREAAIAQAAAERAARMRDEEDAIFLLLVA